MILLSCYILWSHISNEDTPLIAGSFSYEKIVELNLPGWVMQLISESFNKKSRFSHTLGTNVKMPLYITDIAKSHRVVL